MRDDLRPHSHTKPGDGGKLPVPTEADSGIETVSANGSSTVTVNASKDSNLLPTVYVGNSYSGTLSRDAGNNGYSVDTAWAFGYNGSASQWELYINEAAGSDITVEWTVYEL